MQIIESTFQALIFAGFCSSLVVSTEAQAPAQPWSRTINVERIPHKGEIRVVELGVVRQEESGLIGELMIEQDVVESRKLPPLIVEGRDGTFWPKVELQVSNKADGDWKTVSSSLTDSASARITLYSGIATYGMRISLAVLQPLIGKYTFGRALLHTGDAAVFPLSDLSPPASGPKSKP